MRGRKPTPTRLKILAGNPGKRPLNSREPQPAQKMPRCPKHLDKAARAEWRRKAPELFRVGLLTAVDDNGLAGYCMAYSRWVRAEGFLAASGEILSAAFLLLSLA